MSRLIDADGLKGCVIIRPTTQEHMELLRPLYVAAVAHDDIPTAYDVDRVVEQLKKRKNKYTDLADSSNFDGWHQEDIEYSAKAEMCEEAIELVKAGGKND